MGRSLVQNAAYADKVWEAGTSKRKYQADGVGTISVNDDDEKRGTKDCSEALAAGFTPVDHGGRVKLVSKDHGRRKVAREVAGDIEMVDAGPDTVTVAGTQHTYTADDNGMVLAFAVDVEDLMKLGFVKV